MTENVGDHSTRDVYPDSPQNAQEYRGPMTNWRSEGVWCDNCGQQWPTCDAFLEAVADETGKPSTDADGDPLTPIDETECPECGAGGE